MENWLFSGRRNGGNSVLGGGNPVGIKRGCQSEAGAYDYLKVALRKSCRNGGDDALNPVPLNLNAHAHSFKPRCQNYVNTIVGTASLSGVMHPSILNYSNPDVRYFNKTTGETNRDNAHQIKNAACTVGSFNYTYIPLMVGLNAPLTECTCGSVQVDAYTTGGSPSPYQFLWKSSYDGINWNIIGGSGSSAIAQMPCTEGENVFVRAQVTSADSQVQTQTITITSSDSPGHPCMVRVANPNINPISVHPNPVESCANADFALIETGNVAFELWDLTGKRLYHFDNTFDKGAHSYCIDMKSYAAGFYYLKIKTPEESKSILIHLNK